MPSPRLFIRELVHALATNRIKDMSAQLAFWSLLAVFPFCIFLLTIVGYLPLHGFDQELIGMVADIMPEQASQLFERTVKEIVGKQHGVLLLVALVTSVWSASGGMGSTRIALNLAYRVEETRPWWRARLLALVMTLGAAGLIIIATAGLMIGPGVVNTFYEWFELGGAFDRVWPWLRFPMVVVDLLFMLACLYYFLPNVKLKFRILTPGAGVAVALWVGASLVFRWYVAHYSSFARSYGTLGGAVVLVLWLYLSSLTIILGGEINATFERLATGAPHEVKVKARATEPPPMTSPS